MVRSPGPPINGVASRPLSSANRTNTQPSSHATAVWVNSALRHAPKESPVRPTFLAVRYSTASESSIAGTSSARSSRSRSSRRRRRRRSVRRMVLSIMGQRRLSRGHSPPSVQPPAPARRRRVVPTRRQPRPEAAHRRLRASAHRSGERCTAPALRAPRRVDSRPEGSPASRLDDSAPATRTASAAMGFWMAAIACSTSAAARCTSRCRRR